METHIIKYGGSFIISGDKYNELALEELVRLTKEHEDKQFVFIIGGGKLCRNINEVAKPHLEKALEQNKELMNVALDEIGIAVTKINGRVVKQYLEKALGEENVYEDIVDYPEQAVKTNKKVIIATGYKPGVTTDFDMMLLAEAYSATKAYKISDFPVVLDVKPFDFKKEKISEYESLPRMTWQKMIDLVGTDYVAGGNYPLDPSGVVLGAKLAEERPGFTLYIGQKEQLDAMLRGREFRGTIVRN